MISQPDLDMIHPLSTDGDIAVVNLESARLRSWNQFWRNPLHPGIAEYIVEQEQLTGQFLGDPTALDRLDTLINHLARVDDESSRTALIRAQVASTAHRFADAKNYLAKVAAQGEFSAVAERLLLSIDQACGARLEDVLDARLRMAAESGRLEDLVPLGTLHADLREFDEAARIYQQALSAYQETSPFAVAWVCFQLGILWGELIPETQSTRAEYWYRKAIEYVPCYVKARVHLAEICLREGRAADAEALLAPALSSGDPEVSWRLADVMVAIGRGAESKAFFQAALSGYEILLHKHLLAFADHAAEFYCGSGENPRRGFELASVNLANRPTLRAFEQAYRAAVGAGESQAASDILAAAEIRWGATASFRLSPLARCRADSADQRFDSYSHGETHDDAP